MNHSLIQADGTTLPVTHKGTALMQTVVNSVIHKCIVPDILYAPKLSADLFSVSATCERGNAVIFVGKEAFICAAADIVRPKNIQAIGTLGKDKLYRLNTAHQSYVSAVRDGIQEPESEPESEANESSDSEMSSLQVQNSEPATLWHKRLGHLGSKSLNTLLSASLGLNQVASSEFADCQVCNEGKMTRAVIHTPPVTSRVSQKLELIHTDVCGPLAFESMGGAKYFVTFTDDSTRFSWIKVLEKKSDTFAAFNEFKNMAESESDSKIKTIRCDRGGEYMGLNFQEYCTGQGIRIEYTPPRTPEFNGVAERLNRTLEEKVSCMLNEKKMPIEFWAECLSTAVLLKNFSATPTTDGMSSYELWTGKAPPLGFLKVWGSPADVLIPKFQRKKFQAKSWRGIFVGYEDKAFRIWDPVERTIRISRDVRVHENAMPDPSEWKLKDANGEVSENFTYSDLSFNPDFAGQTEIETETVSVEGTPETTENEDTPLVPSEASVPSSTSHFQEASNQGVYTDTSTESMHTSAPSEIQGPLRRSTRQKRPPGPYQRFGSSRIASARSILASTEIHPLKNITVKEKPVINVSVHNSFAELEGDEVSNIECNMSDTPASIVLPKSTERSVKSEEMLKNIQLISENESMGFLSMTADPNSVEEALQSEDASNWQLAIDAEMNSMAENQTWDLVEKPDGVNIVSSKIILRKKFRADGSVEKFKARLVARGFSQTEGVDYFETYAPVVKFQSLRTILALAASEKWEVHQMDVKTAFLNGDLQEDVFMELPEGLKEVGTENLVCKLKRSLYGLKQAPRAWYEKLENELKKWGFKHSVTDHSVFLKGTGDKRVIVAVYVDDIIITGPLISNVLRVKAAFKQAFKMEDFGVVSSLLGMEVLHGEGGMKISQRTYAELILQRFAMGDCKPISSPLNPKETLKESVLTEKVNFPYREAVGSLMYLMVGTRPDLASAVGLVSRYLENPNSEHVLAVKRIFRYLKGTLNYCLDYKAGNSLVLKGYVDTDWGGCQVTRRSTQAYVFLLGESTISWKSKRQTSVALSSTEAEYMGACFATKEAVWLRRMLAELGIVSAAPTLVYTDNQSSIKLINNPVHHERTKHIDIQYHFTREQVDNGILTFEYISTDLQVADSLTKGVGGDKIAFCNRGMGLVDI